MTANRRLATSLFAMLTVTALKAAPPSIDVLLLGYYIWAKPQYVDLCRKEGVNIHFAKREDPTGADPANYPIDYLRQFHVVVVSGPMEKPWDPCLVRGDIKPGIVDNLLEYNRAGGGVVWTPLGAGYGALGWNDSTGARIDAEALDESLDSAANKTAVSVSESLHSRLTYFWTTEITQHPATEGVRGLFLGIAGEWGWPATIPMKFGKSWETLVRGMAETRTVTNKTPSGGKERAHTPSGQTGTYDGRPQVIGVRDAAEGRPGRMMVLPIYTTWTWGNHGHIAMKEAFLFNGDGIHPSDGQTFLLNAWRWLAEPAVTAGLGGCPMPESNTAEAKPVDLPPNKWATDITWDRVSSGPQLRGLFGAHSQYGGGTGSVAEWAEAAKAAGLDYLVFTDDLSKLDEKRYTQLMADCKAASDDSFLAIAGWGADDINGVFRFYPGMTGLPSAARLSADGRLAQHVGIASDSGWVTWPIFAGLSEIPYNPWWEHVVASCAPLVYEGTQLVDNGVERWYRQIESNNMHLLPVSLVHVRRPADLATAVEAAHVTVLRTGSHADIVPRILRSGFSGQVFPSYLTNGPEIVAWFQEGGRDEPYRPNSARFRLLIKVRSEVGLQEVRIEDVVDGSVYRDWRPDGEKEFTAFVDEQMDRQRVLNLVVTDVNGHTAIAPPAYPQMQSNRVWHMGDRLMGLHHVTSWNKDGTQLVYNLESPLGIGYHKGAIGEASGEFSTQHNVALKFHGIEGAGVYPPPFKFRTKISTPQGWLRPAFRYQLALASHDLTILDQVGDHNTPAGVRFDFSGPPLPREPTREADINVRSWLLRQPYMTPTQMMVTEVTIHFKQTCKPNSINLATYNGPDTDTDFNFLCIRAGATGDTTARTLAAGEKLRQKTDFTVGGYLYQAKMLAGTMGFVALDDSVQADSQARVHEFNVRPELLREFQPGDEIKVRMLRVSRAFEAAQGGNEWLQQLIRDYGIGTDPAYPYTVLQGTVKEINYIFDLQAENGGAAVEIGKYPLVSTLPLRVCGIRRNAFCGEYDLDTKRVRPLPYFEGTVTTSVEPSRQAVRLYIGEWLTWDNSDARLSLAVDGVDFALDAHNPMDEPLTVTIAGVPGFEPLKDCRKTLTLPPHQSVKKKVTSAPESVKLVPLKY